MASAVIHIAVAKKVNEVLNRNEKDLYLGAIAPDASKIVGTDRKITHLLTDELWFNEFLPNFVLDDETIVDTDGNKVSLKGITIGDIIYNDYTNLNVQIIDYYNLNFKLFYEEFTYPEPNIKEVPKSTFPLVIDKMGIIISNSAKYNYILKLDKITHFIEYATIYVLERLKADNLI